jgi:hypothetical protein
MGSLLNGAWPTGGYNWSQDLAFARPKHRQLMALFADDKSPAVRWGMGYLAVKGDACLAPVACLDAQGHRT